jgi:hypothetical protein
MRHPEYLRIADALRESVEQARAQYEVASREFREAMNTASDESPHPDEAQHFRNVTARRQLAVNEYAKAVHELNDFLLNQLIPERLKDPTRDTGPFNT